MNPSSSPSDTCGGGSDLLSRWSDADYWRNLCPHLAISGDNIVSAGDAYEEARDIAANEKLRDRLIEDGYALIDSECSAGLRERVARGINELEVQHSLPATFVLLFDETWSLAAESHRLLLRNEKQQSRDAGILHMNGMVFNFDVLAWHIDPLLNKAGFSPHRDRQPDTHTALKDSFYKDGQAKYVTHWMALSDATPENSCLYVIPREFDPGYSEGDDPPKDDNIEGDDENRDKSDEKEQLSDPLSRALSTKQSYQNIRALPRRAGQSLIFTHRIMHWGSRGNPKAIGVKPRVAISFVYSDTEFEAPYLSGETLSELDSGRWSCPPFSIRLLLVCAQLLIYYQRFDLSARTLRACYDYCKVHSDKLHDAYRKKVFVEFVKAMKERMDGGNVAIGVANGGKANGMDKGDECRDENKSEDEEALLEEMLNHSDEFEDDYDDACDHDDSSDDSNGKCGGTKRKLSA